jgi:hypothetical protein
MSNKKEDSHLQPYVDRAIEALIKIDSISVKAVDVAIRSSQMIDLLQEDDIRPQSPRI